MSKVMATGADPKLPPGTNYARCCACGEYFKSPSSFDKHRITDQGERRCLTVSEMVSEGMSKNERGYWITRVFDRTVLDADDTAA